MLYTVDNTFVMLQHRHVDTILYNPRLIHIFNSFSI